MPVVSFVAVDNMWMWSGLSPYQMFYAKIFIYINIHGHAATLIMWFWVAYFPWKGNEGEIVLACTELLSRM
jgi:hypothetical protein